MTNWLQQSPTRRTLPTYFPAEVVSAIPCSERATSSGIQDQGFLLPLTPPATRVWILVWSATGACWRKWAKPGRHATFELPHDHHLSGLGASHSARPAPAWHACMGTDQLFGQRLTRSPTQPTGVAAAAKTGN